MTDEIPTEETPEPEPEPEPIPDGVDHGFDEEAARAAAEAAAAAIVNEARKAVVDIEGQIAAAKAVVAELEVRLIEATNRLAGLGG